MEPVYTTVIGAARVLFAAQGLKFTVRGPGERPAHRGCRLRDQPHRLHGLHVCRVRRLPRGSPRAVHGQGVDLAPPRRGAADARDEAHPRRPRGGGRVLPGRRGRPQAGEIVGVFPEATISRSFELKDFKSGTIRMAQAAGVPVLPVTIWGSQRVWTKGHPKRLGRTNTPIYHHRGRADRGRQGLRGGRGGQRPAPRADDGPAARRPGRLPARSVRTSGTSCPSGSAARRPPSRRPTRWTRRRSGAGGEPLPRSRCGCPVGAEVGAGSGLGRG